MPPRSPSGDDDERSPRTPREDDARSTASSQRSAHKDDDDARSTTSSRRSARKTPRDEEDDDLASVQSEQDAAVAKARALRLLLAFEDSGHKLNDVLKSKDYDAEALLDAFVGREHLKELGNDECDALIAKAGDGVNVTRDQLGHWLKLERSRLCEELMQRLAPAPAPAPAPAVPEGEAVPMSPLSPARSDISNGSDLGDLLFSRLDTLPREAGAAAAAAEAAARQRARDRARALARRHRRAAREGRIQKGDWARSSFRLQPVVERAPLTMDTAPVKVQAAYRGFKSRVGRRRDRRAARDIQTAYRASKARFAAKVMRRRRKRLERDSNERHERSKRLQQLRGELERLKASPAELASAYATVHAKRREERLKRWRDEEAEIMKDLPGDDYVNENDIVCDYSVASSTPTKSSKEGDSVEQAMNPEENKENISLEDADAVERHTIKMYRQSLNDETFAEKVAAGLAVELPPTLVGPDPDSKEEKDLRLKDLRERVERKAHERQAKSEAKGLESVVDPRGTPVMNFGEPLKWIPSKKFKRRPMVASLLKKAQEAEEQGRDGDEAIQAEMKPFMDQAREELGKSKEEPPKQKKDKGYTPGFVNNKGEHVGVTLDSSGTTGAQKTYVEYFQARARARELMVAKKATDGEREKMRAERAKILKRAQGLVERLQNPPKIELSESLGEPADLDLNDPEEGSDDPRGWWRLPPAGEDRERAQQAHKNAVEAHENRDKWFYASVPEDASTVGIDIRKAGQPNVPWPFPSKHLKNVPGPEPMDPDTASLYWWNWARKGLDDDIDKRTEKLLEHAEKQARALDLSDEGTEAAVVAARCRVVLAANASKATLREHSEALLERVRLGPAGRLLQAREHVKERRKHVDRLAEQYKLYLLGQKLLGKKAGPSPWAEKKDTSSDKLRERYLIQLQAWWRGQGYRRRTFREKRDRRVVNALATLVAELGGDASGVAAAASGLSDVFSQRKKAAPPPRVPPSAARVSRATSAVRFSSDEAPPLSRPPSVASSRRPSVESVPEAAPPSPSPRPSVSEVADEPPASQESSARPTPRQQLFVAETPAVVQERSAKVRAAEASAQASEERRRNATGAKRLADPSATGPPRL